MNLKESINYLKNSGYIVEYFGHSKPHANEYSDIGMDPGYDGYANGYWTATITDKEFENTEELAQCSEKYFKDREHLAWFCAANDIIVHFTGTEDNLKFDEYYDGYYSIPFYYKNSKLNTKLGEKTRKVIQNLLDSVYDLDVTLEEAEKIENTVKNNMEEIFNAMDKACEYNANNNYNNLKFDGDFDDGDDY